MGVLDNLPSCMSEHGTEVARTLACQGRLSRAESMVKCTYRTKIGGAPYLVTLTWCRSLMGLGLSLHATPLSYQHRESPASDMRLSPPDLQPWLFNRKRGSKRLQFQPSCPVSAFWDLSAAKYAPSSPEPTEGFFFALVYGHEIILLLGDMAMEACRKTQAMSFSSETTVICRKEHVLGRNTYCAKAQFAENSGNHDIVIECNTKSRDPRLCIRVDEQVVVHVKRLVWNFRGNQTVLIDGLHVEVFWDVHNWLFSPSDGHAIFMFHTAMAADKSWPTLSPLFQWHNSSPLLSSAKDEEHSSFSLFLYAWRTD